jgi:hypothetical protein
VKEARFNAFAKLGAAALIVVWWTAFATAQDLAPRAQTRETICLRHQLPVPLAGTHQG